MKKGKRFINEIAAFERLLDTVPVEKISAEIYCRKYLRHLLDHKKYYLAIYADVLEKLLSHSTKKKEEVVLVDFGAGNGMLGIFAKFCGFKKVFINDIDEKFVAAAENLAMQLGVNTDGYITGDIHAVQLFFTNELPDAIAGTDVIEHVYNLEDFFSTLKQVNPFIISAFTTGSNPKNYFKTRQLKKLQLKDENKGGTPEDFVLFGGSALEPFLKIRQRIIKSELKNPDYAIILKLAKATRGMNEADIVTTVKKYAENGSFPLPPKHPTNTCNPLNSSWTERLVSIEEYRSFYQSNGFEFELYNGFYDEHKKGFKRIFNKLLNFVTNIAGIYFAPYIIFTGSKK